MMSSGMKFCLFSAIVSLSLAFVYEGNAQSLLGSIEGSVQDEHGQPLAGVVVVLSSPALQGQRTATTGADGGYRFHQLRPGTYRAAYSLSGFQRVENEGVVLRIAATVRLDVLLRSMLDEEVLVTDAAPMVDISSTSLGVRLRPELLDFLPLQRSYASVASVTPGVQADASGATVYGSSGAEIAYTVDGVNTTGIQHGTRVKYLNFELIEEVQVLTGGYSAEYGGSTVETLNVITKSGGNRDAADVFGYRDANGPRADLSSAAAAGALTGVSQRTRLTRTDVGFGLGGPILQDKLWYFVAYNHISDTSWLTMLKDLGPLVPGAPARGDGADRKLTRDLYSAKLTWRIWDDHTLSASIFGDPGKAEGALGSLAGSQAHFVRTHEMGDWNGVLSYAGVLGSRVLLDAHYAEHRETLRNKGGSDKDMPSFIDLSDPLGDGTVVFGWTNEDGVQRISGIGFYADESFRRQQASASVTYFGDGRFGGHRLKAGAAFENVEVDLIRTISGGEAIGRYDLGGFYLYEHFFFAREKRDPRSLTQEDVLESLPVDARSSKVAAFIQDRWQIGSRLTMNLGLRWEMQRLYNAEQEVHATIGGYFAPRLGFTYDLLGDARGKLFGHYGRFYESVPMNIVIRSFGGEIIGLTYNFSDQPGDVGCAVERQDFCAMFGGDHSKVDPSLKGQYVSELVLGAEYEVRKKLSVGLKGIRRSLDQVIEDGLNDELEYVIGNPGQGILSHTIDFGYLFGLNETLHELARPERVFHGLELTLNGRLSDRLQFLASALWSRLKGNYDGAFRATTGQLVPNINSAFDLFDFHVNNQGRLSNDRPVQLKLNSSYQFPFDLAVALSAHYRSGTPMTAMGYSTLYGNWEYYLSRRGAFGRTRAEYEADLRLRYGLKGLKRARMELVLDVFNVLNRQGEIARDQRYNLVENDQPLDWVSGEPNPSIMPGDAMRPPTNPAFDTPIAWQAPRSIRLGARISL
jgi:hypothetical protein